MVTAATALKDSALRTLHSQHLFLPTAALVLLGEVALTSLIVLKVPYTEIDYSTYLQQAALFAQKGVRDYFQITGDSGPCVYPAGHLYLYSLFSLFTSSIFQAQVVFAVIYVVNLGIVIALYYHAKAPTVLLPFLALSKRLHSIYALRLFNDPLAISFLYISLLLLIRQRWTAAVITFSAALSIKMNILLFLPALAVVLFRALGFNRSLLLAVAFFAFQVLVSLPFTLPSPTTRSHYLQQAFDLSRVFLYKWTVNWRFVPESVFLSKDFARSLLLIHIGLLASFALYLWTGLSKLGPSWVTSRWNGPLQSVAPISAVTKAQSPSQRRQLESKFAPSADYILSTFFTANLIGIICSRSLHYQFYSWYAHQIPFLLWRAQLPIVVKILLPITIELAWNTFPSTSASSALLLVSHVILLGGLAAAHAGDALQDEAQLQANAGIQPTALSSRASTSLGSSKQNEPASSSSIGLPQGGSSRSKKAAKENGGSSKTQI
ncbi:dolichyl-P-Man:Man(5)GlcNAc(2)-PP-dolichol alpha-1,3-mannosyltransferase [Tilletia horrida]|nr:dolichyl-P-Man:Man(5)GlcNAc(2)-PP-dolichol alpha-1,3-mannosyltransferase [Tilletia horrida]